MYIYFTKSTVNKIVPGEGGWFFHFSTVQSPFFLLKFIILFTFLIKYYSYYVYYHCILSRYWQAVRTSFSFVPTALLSIYSRPSPSIFVLLYFVLLHSCCSHACVFVENTRACASSSFLTSILYGTCFFPTVQPCKCIMRIQREKVDILVH